MEHHHELEWWRISLQILSNDEAVFDVHKLRNDDGKTGITRSSFFAQFSCINRVKGRASL